MYLPPQFDQYSLHGVIALPLGEARQHRRVDNSVACIDGGQVHLADELDSRGLVRVVRAAVHLDTVDTVLVNGLREGERRKSCRSALKRYSLINFMGLGRGDNDVHEGGLGLCRSSCS